jgi:ribosomal protein S18 acetylase RimI-like enzyme
MKRNDEARVRSLDPAEAGEVVAVLSEAFYDYPVMRFVLGSGGDYRSRLDQLVTFFVMSRVLRSQVLLGVGRPGELSAVALVSYPRRQPNPPELATLRDRTWAQLGQGAHARYETFGAATAPFAVEGDHLYLGMIGVRASVQGQGFGRTLLDAVHALSESDAKSIGVALSTEVESNVGLYEHFGYELLGSAPVGSAFTTWVMLRRDSEG